MSGRCGAGGGGRGRAVGRGPAGARGPGPEAGGAGTVPGGSAKWPREPDAAGGGGPAAFPTGFPANAPLLPPRRTDADRGCRPLRLRGGGRMQEAGGDMGTGDKVRPVGTASRSSRRGGEPNRRPLGAAVSPRGSVTAPGARSQPFAEPRNRFARNERGIRNGFGWSGWSAGTFTLISERLKKYLKLYLATFIRRFHNKQDSLLPVPFFLNKSCFIHSFIHFTYRLLFRLYCP